MYSGTLIRNKSGAVMGAHQKIDRVARRHLKSALPANVQFPAIKSILHFEGKHGPDGIKSKSPAREEPWHYIDPTDHADTQLLELIDDHVNNLIASLADTNEHRAAFEAAWLAHAIVDGLTPAHHYPLEEKIEELWGKPKDERLTIKDKNIIKGVNRRDTLSKNWEYWGAKGVFTTHFLFEWGFATTIAPLTLEKSKPSPNDRIRVESEGVNAIFREALHAVYDLKMYDTFHKKGWTRSLARQSREKLAPIIIRTVTLAWYYAAVKAAERIERRGTS
jgi:hypothetical protein